MVHSRVLFSLALLLMGTSLISNQNAFALADEATPNPKIVTYVPNWIDVESFANNIDYSKLTHINIAFENPESDDGELSFNSENDTLIAKAHENNVQVLLSIGGGTASSDKKILARYSRLLSDSKRAKFVAGLAKYIVQHKFDGLDVDIEGQGIDKNYGAFIKQLSQSLRPKGKLLTAALSQGYGGDKVPASVFDYLDWLNIMAYDGTGPWDKDAPGQHSSFEFAKSNVEYWLGRGLTKSKAILGVPFYGYGFGEAFRANDYPYSSIIATYPDAAQFDQIGNTIWYNGVATIKAKAQYARDQGLGGIMIWSLDLDASGDDSLLSAVNDGLGIPAQKDDQITP